VLDGKPGLERFYAVCTREPLPLAQIDAAVRSAVAGGPETVRRGDPLRGLPGGSSQATLLVEKR
jgi:hypothetical protein